MRKEKLKALVLAQIFLAFSLGLIGPIYVIYFEKISNNITFVPLLVGIYWIVIGTIEPIFGRYIDSLGRTRSFLFGNLLEAIAILLYPLANDILMLFSAQILAAIGYSVSTPASYSLMADLTSKKSRGREMGKIDGAFNIAYGSSAIVSAFILSSLGFSYLFILSAIIYLLSGIIVVKNIYEE